MILVESLASLFKQRKSNIVALDLLLDSVMLLILPVNSLLKMTDQFLQIE